MPSRDRCHQCMICALQKDGWTITDDPLYLAFAGIDFYVDLGAERLLAANRGEEKIAVEIKTFQRASVIAEFHTALGQFMNYRLALANNEPDRILYLAVPEETYLNFFLKPFGQIAIQHYELKLIIYSISTQEIVTWINSHNTVKPSKP